LNDSSAVPEYVLSFSAARLVALHLQKQIIRSVAEATLRKVKLSPVRAARRVVWCDLTLAMRKFRYGSLAIACEMLDSLAGSLSSVAPFDDAYHAVRKEGFRRENFVFEGLLVLLRSPSQSAWQAP
jgi:hypothetical protein